MEQFAIGADFKSAPARRNERERFDAFAEFKDFGRQTDGLGRVVSNNAIFDRDFGLHAASSFPTKRVRKPGEWVKVWNICGTSRSAREKNAGGTPGAKRGQAMRFPYKLSSDCVSMLAFRRQLRRRVHRQSNKKKRRTIPLPEIYDSRRRAVKYRAARCAAFSRRPSVR